VNGVGVLDLADDYGEAYIEFRRKVDRDQLQGAIEMVETRLGSLSPEQRAGETGQSLEAQLDELRLAEALQVGKADLVQRATVPELELIQANALGLVANLAPTSRSGYYYPF
jgi:hypothetical protein